TPPTLSTSGVTNSPVGTYPIIASGGLDNNYSFSFVNGTLTVTKATPSLSITSANSGQAGSTISLTASTNSTGAITWSVVSGNGSVSGSTLTLLSAGSVTIQASLAADANYVSATAQQTITISAQTAPTITYANVTKIYGDAPFAATASSNSAGALTYSITSGNSFATIHPSTGTVTILGAGTVTLRVDQAANGTFAAGSQTATLTIGKKTLTASAVNATRAYNSANPAFTVTFSGFVGSDNASAIDIQPSVGTAATLVSNAGTYTITVSGGSDNNYTFSYASGTLTITKITPTLNITSANVGQSGTSINLAASSNSTGAITWTVVSGNGTISGNSVNLGAAGSVTVQANLAADVNYNSATSQQVISITNQTVPTITYADVTKTYGDAPFAATATSNSPGTLTYSITSGNSLAAVNSATGTVTIVGAGTVTLKVDQAANGSFAATSKTATLTISKKTLTATADGKTRGYNSSNPTFTISYAGFVNTESASVLDVLPTAATAATPTSNVGTYAIVPSGGSDNNYSFNYVNGTLTITSINPSLSITSTNSGQAGSTINLTAATNSTGAVTWSVVSGNGSISGSTLTLLSPSSVTVQASLAADINYNAASVQQTITITPKTTPTITFANFSATYGDAAFTPSISSNSPGAFTYSITAGNAFATINPTTGLITILGAGTVTIQVNQASSGTFAASSTTATLTIYKANRTVNITSANSAQAGTTLSLTGNTSPTGGTLNWSIQSQSGTLATVSGSTLTAGPNSGSLVIRADAAADANYNAASATQTINISTLTTPTITYSDIVKTFGDGSFNATATSNSSGALTYSITSGNSFATIDANTGLVTILGAGSVTLQVSQAANGTFAATTKTATLTINKATRTLTITSASIGNVGSQINLAASATPTATVNWSVTNGTGAATLNGSTLTFDNAGDITISATIPADANYLAASASQTITISPVTGFADDLSNQKVQLSVHPNPYETEATLNLGLPSSAVVTVEVISSLGVSVATLAEKASLAGGNHSYTLGQLPAATYLVKVSANDSVQYLRVVKQ
ncbi:MAG: T9SS type A sorting domain-containing protein, partial [Cytophagales bacterium]|nr:T9SS type A sorting domain-containing protein [Cytophagales bacterium]